MRTARHRSERTNSAPKVCCSASLLLTAGVSNNDNNDDRDEHQGHSDDPGAAGRGRQVVAHARLCDGGLLAEGVSPPLARAMLTRWSCTSGRRPRPSRRWSPTSRPELRPRGQPHPPARTPRPPHPGHGARPLLGRLHRHPADSPTPAEKTPRATPAKRRQDPHLVLHQGGASRSSPGVFDAPRPASNAPGPCHPSGPPGAN